jgi:hypothetical protein
MDTIEIGQLNILDREPVQEYSDLIMEVMDEFNQPTPPQAAGYGCYRKVVARRGLILFNRPKGRGIKPLRHE